MNIFSVLDTAVQSAMTGNASLITELGGTAIYKNQAPDNAPLPYVVWNWQSNVDEGLTPSRMWNSILNARAFAATEAQAKAIDAQLDAAFDRVTLTVTGWTNFFSRREFAFSQANTEPNGVKTFVVGGFYRIRIGQ